MDSKNVANIYKDISINSAGKLKSILMLIDKAIDLLNVIEGKDSQFLANTDSFRKIQNIIAQLQMALNFKNGKVAKEIFFIYDYIFVELEKKDEFAIKQSLVFLKELKNTLLELSKKA